MNGFEKQTSGLEQLFPVLEVSIMYSTPSLPIMEMIFRLLEMNFINYCRNFEYIFKSVAGV